jgi:hypothetical protein
MSIAPIRTISTPEVRQLLDDLRPRSILERADRRVVQGENISGSRRVPWTK